MHLMGKGWLFLSGEKLDWFELQFVGAQGIFFFPTDKALQLKEEAIKQMVFRCFGVFLSHLHF